MSEEHPRPNEGPKTISVNESLDAPLDDLGRMNWELDKWVPITKFGPDQVWRVNGDNTEFRERIISLGRVFAPNGQTYSDTNVERFIPSVAFDVKSKREVAVRRKVITHSPEGQPVFPARTEPAYVFALTHRPDGWSEAEWEPTLRELEPLIQVERGVKEGEQAAIAASNRNNARLAGEQADPTGTLAAGIARGVAEALRQLGAQPKKP